MKPMSNSPRSQLSLGQILKRVLATGKITRADEVFFFKTLASGAALNDHEMDLVTDVLNRLQMGLLKVAD